MLSTAVVLQFGGLPEFLPELVGIAGTLVLVLMLVAAGGFVYKQLTGGVEWPEDREEDPDALSRGGEDDEWDYY